jgi:hypothetical protein
LTFTPILGLSQPGSSGIDNIEVSCSIAYLPSVNSASIKYTMAGGKFNSKSDNVKKVLKKNRFLEIVSKDALLELQSIYQIDSLTLTFSDEEMNQLIHLSSKVNFQGLPLYGITTSQLSDFFEANSIIIDFKAIENTTRIEDVLMGAIDGAPFNIRLQIDINEGRDILYEFSGNLVASPSIKDIRGYMAFYSLVQDDYLFPGISLSGFFNLENRLILILRYFDFVSKL